MIADIFITIGYIFVGLMALGLFVVTITGVAFLAEFLFKTIGKLINKSKSLKVHRTIDLIGTVLSFMGVVTVVLTVILFFIMMGIWVGSLFGWHIPEFLVWLQQYN